MSRSTPESLAESGTNESGLQKLEIEEWRNQYGIVAGVTGSGDGFDLGLWGSNAGNVTMGNWKRFQDSFGSQFVSFVVGHQQHGTLVGTWREGESGLLVREGHDGHVTNRRGVLLTVLIADCVPVYLYAPEAKAIALLHAGWRGIAAGVLESGVESLQATGVVRNGDIVMHCGVSVCGSCYEVGPEVIKGVVGTNVDSAQTLDLRQALAERASKLGIPSVTISPYCTVHDSDRFHSYRAAGNEAGRMAAYLGMPLA